MKFDLNGWVGLGRRHRVVETLTKGPTTGLDLRARTLRRNKEWQVLGCPGTEVDGSRFRISGLEPQGILTIYK